MRILIVMDPIEGVDIKKDTTVGFILAAQARGHSVHCCGVEGLFVKDGQGGAHARSVTLDPSATPFYTTGPVTTEPRARTTPCGCAATHPSTAPTSTRPTCWTWRRHPGGQLTAGIRYANEKLFAQVFPELCPETLVTRNIAQIKDWLATRSEPLVVKPVDGHGGAGVFVISPGDRNLGSILETLTEEGTRWVVAQAYLPAAREGDKRIIMIDGEPKGAILRVPRDDDNRGNIHVGGTVQHVDLTERDLEICAAVGPALRKEGLWFVGLDVIGGYLTEVNVTSPTGIREVKDLTGVDLGDAFVAWVEDRLG